MSNGQEEKLKKELFGDIPGAEIQEGLKPQTPLEQTDAEINEAQEARWKMEGQLMKNFGQFGVENDFDPIEFVDHWITMGKENPETVINPAVRLMLSDDPYDWDVAKKALSNQFNMHASSWEMNPKERAALDGRPYVPGAGAQVEWKTLAQKAAEFSEGANAFRNNPMALAQIAYERMRNLEVGKIWTLDDSLSTLKTKDGQTILRGVPQKDEGGY